MDRASILTAIEPLLADEYNSPDLGNQEDPLDELMYITLSKQTELEDAAEAYDRLVAKFENWQAVLDASEEEVSEQIKGIIWGESDKASQIQTILEEIRVEMGDLDNLVDEDWDFLREMNDDALARWFTSITHVGPKTTYCVMLFSFKRDKLPVDTHVHRILKRLDLVAPDRRAEAASEEIQKYVPDGKAYSLHVNMVSHGKKTCTARNPNCDECVIERFCAYAGFHVRDKDSRWT